MSELKIHADDFTTTPTDLRVIGSERSERRIALAGMFYLFMYWFCYSVDDVVVVAVTFRHLATQIRESQKYLLSTPVHVINYVRRETTDFISGPIDL